MANYRWRVHALKRSLADFAAPWDALNQRLLAGHPLLDSRYVGALLHHFGDGREHLCQLERQGETVGLCILKPAKAGIWTSFFPPLAALGPSLLRDTAGLEKLPAQLPGLTGQVDLLGQDPHYSPAFDQWPRPHHRMEYELTINIRLQGDFESYWAERSKKLRDTLRNRDNRLSKAACVPRLLCLETPEAMREAVARYGELEWSGWKGREGSAIGKGNVQERFYVDLLESFARTGQAAVYEFWLGERLASSQLIITSPRMMIGLKMAYDESLAALSPGRMLLREVIRDAFKRLPGGTLEAYTNAGQDLMPWATDQRWIEHISLYRSQAVHQMLSALKAGRNLITNFIPKPSVGGTPAA